jgi:uncharacterized protein YdgA (DUF945 family)
MYMAAPRPHGRPRAIVSRRHKSFTRAGGLTENGGPACSDTIHRAPEKRLKDLAMRKAVTFGTAALVLLALGLPPVFGMLTESNVRARVAAIDRTAAWNARVQSFERGWFRSRVKIQLGLEPQYLPPADPASLLGIEQATIAALLQDVPLAIDFAHGPIAVLDGVHLGIAALVARLDEDANGIGDLEQRLGVPHLFEFRGRTGFAGALAFDADVPPIGLAVGATTVDFSGAALEGTFARNRLVSTGGLDRFEFSSPTGTFSVRDARGSVDNEIRSAYLMPGNAAFSIERIAIVDAASGPMPRFEAANVSFDSAVSLDAREDLLDARATYAIASLLVDGTRVADAHVGLAFRRIDVAALERYFAALEELKQPANGRALDALLPVLERALKASPSFALDPVRFRLDDEPFAGNLEVVAVNPAPPRGLAQNPAALLDVFTTTADVELSKKLAQRLALLAALRYVGEAGLPPDQLRNMAEAQSGIFLLTLVAQGILTDTGDGYRAVLRLADGALTVNGSVLPFGLP